MNAKIDDIIFGDRLREQMDDISSLAESIKKFGGIAAHPAHTPA